MAEVVKLDIPAQYSELFQPSQQWRHLVYKGGRSSGKSYQVALSRLILGSHKRLRGLCTREFQNSMDDSVKALLGDLVAKYGLKDWQVLDKELRNLKTGSEIHFKGLHNNAQTIKSFEGVDWCWVEEAQSVSAESINTLIPTIRKKGSQIIWTYNPLTEHDPVKELVEDAYKDKGNCYVLHINSDAVENLLSDEIKAEREAMKENNPDMYAHVWLGQPLTAKTGTVFGKQLAQAEIDGRIGSVPYDGASAVYTAFDLGVGDSTAIWWFQMAGREIHFIDYYESSGEDLGHYLAVLHNKPYNYATHYLPHDARQRELQTGKTRVEFFEQNGFHNVEVLRPTNFTLGNDDINLIARPAFSRVWIDREKCARGLECLRAYHYEYDEKNKLLKSKPEHDWSSHASSAFIYALMAATESAEAQTLQVKFKTYTPKAFRKSTSNDYF
jgi:phage terminase large subunit